MSILLKRHNSFTIKVEFKYNLAVVKELQILKERIDVQWNPDGGSWLVVADQWSQLYHALKDRFTVAVDESVSGYHIEKAQVSITDALFSNIKENLSKKIKANLYDYQVKDVITLASGKAFINANDMGLGKTLESLCVAEVLKGFPCLIVCPVSLKRNWQNEINKFTNRTSKIVSSKTARKDIADVYANNYDYVIVNYEFLRKHGHRFTNRFKVAFFDEAHRLKNPKALLVKAIQEHINPHKSYFISGTPIMNRPSELWVILNMIKPDVYNDYWMFVKYFCEKRFFNGRVFYDGGRHLDVLHKILSHYMVRNTKDDVLEELPAKQYITQIVPLLKEQSKMYDEVTETFKRWYQAQKIKDGEVSMESTFLKMLRLKQVAVMPSLLEDEEHGTKIKSGKLERLDEILDELFAKDEKVIVFSQFKKVVEKVVERYEKKTKVVWFHGGTNLDDRQYAVDQFQNNPDVKLFVATQATAGVGITLTASSYIVHLDKVWNPSITEQANDRIHRIGQKKVSTIISLVSEGTIDEYIEKRLQEKEDVFHTIMQGKLKEKDVEKLYNVKDLLSSLIGK